jgi:hypothetical protein
LGLSFFVAGDVVLDPGGELRKLFLARHGRTVQERSRVCQQASEVWLARWSQPPAWRLERYSRSYP